MDVFIRYAVSLGVATISLFAIVFLVERYYEGMIPHNTAELESDEISVALPAGKLYEKCVGMHKNQQLEYGFKSETPLVFNLHFHSQGKTHYPFKSKPLDKLEATFHPEDDSGYYCLMWENPGKETVQLEYRYMISVSKTE